MKTWLGLARLFLVYCAAALATGCVEYRLERVGQPDRYFGWAHTKKGLDPKLGTKGKIYLVDHGRLRPYLGGNYRRNGLRIAAGGIYYLSGNSSIEIGYRHKFLSTDRYYQDRRVISIDPFKDADEIFYIGGLIRW